MEAGDSSAGNELTQASRPVLEELVTVQPTSNERIVGNHSNASIAEELSVDEDFYSCRTTISTDDFNGIYAADSEDNVHQVSSASISEIPESS